MVVATNEGAAVRSFPAARACLSSIFPADLHQRSRNSDYDVQKESVSADPLAKPQGL